MSMREAKIGELYFGGLTLGDDPPFLLRAIACDPLLRQESSANPLVVDERIGVKRFEYDSNYLGLAFLLLGFGMARSQ